MVHPAYIVVLWHEQFEALPASLFMTQFREAALPVRLISLSQRRLRGRHGLRLLPDWTLEEALPHLRALRALILPCGGSEVQALANDPRVFRLMAPLRLAPIPLVIGESARTEVTHHPLFQGLCLPPVFYPAPEHLVPFAATLTASLGGSVPGPHPLITEVT